jgi:hypothetical protein
MSKYFTIELQHMIITRDLAKKVKIVSTYCNIKKIIIYQNRNYKNIFIFFKSPSLNYFNFLLQSKMQLDLAAFSIKK